MFLENNYIVFDDNLNINSISSYRVLMIKFINKFIDIYKSNYHKNEINKLFIESLIYSKYYVYYKSLNCIYSNDIMEILLNIDHHFYSDKKIKT
jgi:hypothetical protein